MGASGLTDMYFYYNKNADLQDCMNGWITSNAMGWNLTCIIQLLYLFPIYHMDVRNIVCQDITYLYMDSNLTSYWTIMMATMDTRC